MDRSNSFPFNWELFDPKTDKIDAYLVRFEKACEMLKIQKADYCNYLCPFLQGTALNIFYYLSESCNLTYDILKENFLKCFGCTSEDYRKGFRESKPENQESYIIFALKLKSDFLNWLKLNQIMDADPKLVNLLLCEQFLESVPFEMKCKLQAQALTDFDVLVQNAENLRKAMNCNIFDKSSKDLPHDITLSENCCDDAQRKKTKKSMKKQKSKAKLERSEKSRAFYSNFAICKLCNGKGHRDDICPLRNHPSPCKNCFIGGHSKKSCPLLCKKKSKITCDDVSQNVKTKPKEIICKLCNLSGHISRWCRNVKMTVDIETQTSEMSEMSPNVGNDSVTNQFCDTAEIVPSVDLPTVPPDKSELTLSLQDAKNLFSFAFAYSSETYQGSEKKILTYCIGVFLICILIVNMFLYRSSV